MSETPNTIVQRTRASVTTSGKRTLKVELNDNRQAEFSFEGFWTGHDVRAVMTAMAKAYHKHKSATRRATISPVDNTE